MSSKSWDSLRSHAHCATIELPSIRQVHVDVILTLIGGASGGAIGWFAGFRLGTLVSDQHAWRYWALNVGAMLLALGGEMLGLRFGLLWLLAGSLGFLAAGLTGLKYGRGKIVGRGSRIAPKHEPVEIPPLWED